MEIRTAEQILVAHRERGIGMVLGKRHNRVAVAFAAGSGRRQKLAFDARGSHAWAEYFFRGLMVVGGDKRSWRIENGGDRAGHQLLSTPHQIEPFNGQRYHPDPVELAASGLHLPNSGQTV